MRIINNFAYRFHNQNIKTKLLLSFLTVTFPMLVMGIFSYIMLEREINEKISKSTVLTLQQIKLNVENRFDEVVAYTSYLRLNDTIRDLLKQDYSKLNDYGKLRNKEEINRIFAGVNSTFFQNRSYISIFDLDGPEYFSWSFINKDLIKVRENPWFKKLVESNDGSILWLGVDENYVNNYRENGKYVFSVARLLEDEDSGQVLGVIYAAISEESVSSYIQSNSIYKSTKRYIIDKDSIIRSSNNEDMINLKLDIDTSQSYNTLIKLGGRKYLMNIVPLKYMQWNIVELIDYEEVFAEISAKQKTFIAIIGLFLLLFGLLTYMLSSNLSKRIKSLQQATDKLQRGQLDLRVEDQYRDEIGFLAQTFNQMVVRIKQLLQQVYEEQETRRLTEIKMLQAQINPHFLFNTLNSIKMVALMSRANNVANMISALGGLLASTIRDQNECIPLEGEINNIRDYVLLQKVRYNNRFDIKVCIPEKYMSYKVIKFILQPIVENSIQHGFDSGMDRQGLIKIKGLSIRGSLYLFVTDNGKGVPAEKLGKLLSTPGTSSIGLNNVEKRINLTYGNQYGLRIKSKINKGTVVRLKLPILET